MEKSNYIITQKGLMYSGLIGLELIGVHCNELTKELNFTWQ